MLFRSQEAGVASYDSAGWFAVLAPKGTPGAITDRINQEIRAALSDPAFASKLAELGAIPAASTPAELKAFISAETAKWRKVISDTGIPVEQ